MAHELLTTEIRPGIGHAALEALADRLLGEIHRGHTPPGAGRCYELRYADDDAEAWLIAWPAGTGLAVHDHSGSEAVVHVVRGHLRERYAVAGTDGLQTRWLDHGKRVRLPTDHAHEIANDTTGLAVSLHVYSPRLGPLGFRCDDGTDTELTGIC